MNGTDPYTRLTDMMDRDNENGLYYNLIRTLILNRPYELTHWPTSHIRDLLDDDDNLVLTIGDIHEALNALIELGETNEDKLRELTDALETYEGELTGGDDDF